MKRLMTFLILMLFATTAFAQLNNSTVGTNNIALQGGVGLGSVIAVVASWSRNESILWAILHGIFGWFYVIYFAATRQQD